MRIISEKAVKTFVEAHPGSRKSMAIWIDLMHAGRWENPAQVKEVFGSADVIPNGRMVFNVGGNKFRIVCLMGFRSKTVFVRFVGTHKEYDSIDATTI